MKNVELKYNEQYSNHQGLSNETAELVSAPNLVGDSYLATAAISETQFTYTDQETGELVTAVIPAGSYTVSMRGNQYNAEKQVIGAKFLFNINYKEGQAGPLLTFTTLTANGAKPIMTITSRTVVDRVTV